MTSRMAMGVVACVSVLGIVVLAMAVGIGPRHHPAALLALGTLGLAGAAAFANGSRAWERTPSTDLAGLLGRSLAARGLPSYPAREEGDAGATPRAHLLRAGVVVADPASVGSYVVSTLGPRMADLASTGEWPPHLRLAAACILSDPRTPGGAATWAAAARLGIAAARARTAGCHGCGLAFVPLAESVAKLSAPVLETHRDRLADTTALHAYANTAIMGLLAGVRADRAVVLQDMAWLRASDLALWHALNDMGRPSCHVPALGPAEHFRAEVEAGGPLSAPCVAATVSRLTAKPVPRVGDPRRTEG